MVHVTLGCWKTDGSDLEYFKQRAIDDEHEQLNDRPIHPDFVSPPQPVLGAPCFPPGCSSVR